MANTYAASEQQGFSQLSQVTDGVTAPSYKWFNLQNNVLDGSFHPIDNSGTYEIGWWGTTLSDASGNFATGPNLTVTYGNVMSIHTLTLSGDSLLNEFPVNFTIQLYNGASLLYTETVTGNNQVTWTKYYSTVYDVTKIIYTITQINTANRTVKITEATNLFQLRRSDTLKPKINDTDDHRANFYRGDSVKVKLSEVNNLTNIHTVMDAPLRQVFGKVEITYTDPFLDNSITIAASETGSLTDATSTADNQTATQYKWFSLSNNKLDGTYRLMPTDGSKTYEVGWWGTTASDASGNFASPPTLTVTFNSRSIYTLSVFSDNMLNEYPVNFTITLYDSNNAVLNTQTVTNNTTTSWQLTFTNPILNVAKMVLSISKWSLPDACVKIIEFYTSVVETYLADDVVSIHLLEEQDFQEATLPIGNISANEIDIELINLNRKFDPANTASPLYGLLKRNRKIKAWLGANITPTIIEWYQLGEFWSLNWDSPISGVTTAIVGRDKLELMRISDYTTSLVWQNVSLYTLAQYVLQDYGLTSSQYVIDTNLQNTIIPYAYFGITTHRSALALIAEAALGRLYCNRTGQVVIEAYSPQQQSLYKFDENKSIIDIKRPLKWDQIANYVSINVTPLSLGTTQQVLNVTTPIPVAANSTVTSTLLFTNLPCTNVAIPAITADTGISIKSYNIYAWGISITFQNTSASNGNVNTVTVQGQPVTQLPSQVIVAQDATSIRDNGLQKYALNDNYLIQTASTAQTAANQILASYKDPRNDAIIDARGNIALQLGDRVTVPDLNNVTQDYSIIRQDIHWDGTLGITTEGRKITS